MNQFESVEFTGLNQNFEKNEVYKKMIQYFEGLCKVTDIWNTKITGRLGLKRRVFDKKSLEQHKKIEVEKPLKKPKSGKDNQIGWCGNMLYENGLDEL